MNESKKRFSGLSFSNGVGSSSLLVIFVILCLISFATLSIVSANADLKLSAKVLNRTTAYYEANNEAQQSLSGLDNTLSALYAASADEEAYFQSAGHSKSFVIPITEQQSLEIRVTILYPASVQEPFYRVDSWQVTVNETILFEEEEDFLPLFQ